MLITPIYKPSAVLSAKVDGVATTSAKVGDRVVITADFEISTEDSFTRTGIANSGRAYLTDPDIRGKTVSYTYLPLAPGPKLFYARAQSATYPEADEYGEIIINVCAEDEEWNGTECASANPFNYALTENGPIGFTQGVAATDRVTLTVSKISGVAESVALSPTITWSPSAPAGMTVTRAPASCTPDSSCNSTYTFSFDGNAVEREYTATISATSQSGIVRTTESSLSVWVCGAEEEWSGDACVVDAPPPLPAELTLKATRVRSGQPSAVTWSVTGLEADSGTACGITSDPSGLFTQNWPGTGISWSGTNVPTANIEAHTILTLRCTNDGWASPQTKTAAIDLIPAFEEI